MMAPPPSTNRDQSHGPKKKACVECRQQKMRCEGDSCDGTVACARCKRLNIACVFSTPYQRVHKRKRLQELENETNNLKQELQSINPATSTQSGKTNNNGTEPRSIDHLELSPSVIDTCFERYFNLFHQALPILDSTMSPNDVYENSTILFWIIVSVGSRGYEQRPWLVNALAGPVTQLMLASLNSRIKPLESIMGILVALAWPFPTANYFRDSGFIHCGALLHMALQCGLHTPYLPYMNVQSFKNDAPLTEPNILKRAQLWAHVVITYQRICTGTGQAALISFEPYNEQEKFKSILQQLPATIQLQLQLSTLVVRAQKTFLEFVASPLDPQQERTLDTVLQMLNSQLDTLQTSSSSSWDTFHINVARLEFCGMYFFKTPGSMDVQTCQHIFNCTVKVFEHIRDQHNDHDLHIWCPKYAFQACLLGITLMLRILKGPYATFVDQERGASLYQSLVQFTLSCSICQGDLPSRGAAFADSLWKSDKIFKNLNGTFNGGLRIRNRLAVSVVYDAILLWKSEIEQPNEVASRSHTGGPQFTSCITTCSV
ncbi:hypothetical protein BT63DRAFT_45829 [Microthyrium microscopicum]|uniref:Zn(2)-C6 fungal-type domain-containing protein n=1 Tax=Microthyrium microscopicum TaxID=703497 RepID=A0A6A6U1J8_9PEZI|nr:hypothetical protein BT63DRAFT_45829 [Microthyrium microscopicum]